MKEIMTDEKKRLIIIDGNSLLHRAFHALPPLTTKKGELVNAIYGFLLVFLKVIKEFQPDFLVACFDLPAPTFRHQKFKEYKAKRPKIPEDLSQQIPKIKEILKAFGVAIFEKEGFEADDIIGTIAKLAQRQQIFPQLEIIIISGDLDILQLVNPQTKVYLLKKGVKETILYSEKEVKEKYQGLRPEQLPDFKALKGDPSDNIPGVIGIGEKTAIALIKDFGSIENIYLALQESFFEGYSQKYPQKIKENLIKAKEQVFFAKTLNQIQKNVPLDFSLSQIYWQNYNKEKVIGFFQKLEFLSLIPRLP